MKLTPEILIEAARLKHCLSKEQEMMVIDFAVAMTEILQKLFERQLRAVCYMCNENIPVERLQEGVWIHETPHGPCLAANLLELKRRDDSENWSRL